VYIRNETLVIVAIEAYFGANYVTGSTTTGVWRRLKAVEHRLPRLRVTRPGCWRCRSPV